MVSDRTLLNQTSLGWLLLIALVVLGAGLGLRDPWPADEPRFALIAREMVESGQWLFPMRGGELYPDKPPLLDVYKRQVLNHAYLGQGAWHLLRFSARQHLRCPARCV